MSGHVFINVEAYVSECQAWKCDYDHSQGWNWASFCWNLRCKEKVPRLYQAFSSTTRESIATARQVFIRGSGLRGQEYWKTCGETL